MTAPTSGDRPCIESRPHSAHEWHGYPPDVWRCPGVTAPTSLAETLAEVTYQHLRTSTSGWYDSAPVVGCSCGVGLANTPHADHVARAQAEAARAWLVTRLKDGDVVARVARAVAGLEDGEDWPDNITLGGGSTGTRDDEYRNACYDEALHNLAALTEVLTDD